jgi:hypothetical protein
VIARYINMSEHDRDFRYVVTKLYVFVLGYVLFFLSFLYCNII